MRNHGLRRIAYNSRSPLVRIEGAVKALQCVVGTLRLITLPVSRSANALYQKDDAEQDTTRASQRGLQDGQMLPKSPFLPDLSQIEHAWEETRSGLLVLSSSRSEDEL
ncbi:hypothetical protein TNCV_3295121 [Trichonephila clavipes]|uniref:Uncharacterized protein n=1 Tax=Trichonephila clavipes TaxID=2585209 RepID=A0A8X6T236_TRICX|nr:hypothetical protein TNCV_3295121 [Trichonephila clavipes]